MKQIQIDFEPGATQTFHSLMETVRHVVYSGQMKQAAIAASMDRAPSKLTRQLGGELKFSVEDLELLIDSTGDLTPVFYLVEKYLQQRGTPIRNELALKKAGKLMGELSKVMAQLDAEQGAA